jgi:hypothetical protein
MTSNLLFLKRLLPVIISHTRFMMHHDTQHSVPKKKQGGIRKEGFSVLSLFEQYSRFSYYCSMFMFVFLSFISLQRPEVADEVERSTQDGSFRTLMLQYAFILFALSLHFKPNQTNRNTEIKQEKNVYEQKSTKARSQHMIKVATEQFRPHINCCQRC